MARNIARMVTGVGLIIIVSAIGASAQRPTQTANPKTATLVSIITHRNTDGPVANDAVIRAALADTDGRIRELGLTAIVSRAMAPVIAPNDPTAVTDWAADRSYLSGLRPLVLTAVVDPEENVRVQALAALAALEADLVTHRIRISRETEALFIARFDSDSSNKVRTRIVKALVADGDRDSARIRNVISNALADPQPAMRHAGLAGVDRFATPIAIDLLLQALNDSNATVKGQAAIGLSKHSRSITADQLSRIEAARSTEKDAGVRVLIQRVLSAAKP